MTNAIALFDGSQNVVLSEKTGKTGSFARALAFATREVRQGLGQAMYAKWLASGQYRPIVNDILSCGLVPKSALSYVSGLIPESGAVRKEQLIGLCLAVEYATRNKRNKAGEQVIPKGQKAFVYGVVCAIANESRKNEEYVDAE
jgi:hypothetical protein